jgi:hypothetical protein
MMRNPWTDEDNAILKTQAGKIPATKIAERLGRTKGAVVLQASKLKISLRTERHITRPSKKTVQMAGGVDFSK